MENNSTTYLGEEKVGKLMVKFSVPCVISMLVASLYNMVDQVFIGHGVGYLGNGATNVVFPITVIALALSLMIGNGCAAYMSLCHGRGDREKCHKSVGNSITVLVVISIIITVLFLALKEQILWAFGATENNIEYAREYFEYLIFGIPFYIFGNAAICVIRADGDPKFAMITTLSGCIINVILDPIAIFVLHWGMMGAAVATVAGQVVTAFMGLFYLFRTKTFKLQKSSFKPDFKILGSVIPLGGSSFLTQVSIVFVMAVMNNTLVAYGANSRFGADIPLTVVGIVMKVFQIVISFVIGIAAGTQPIIGYNYGARKFDRVKELFKKMMTAEIIVGAIGMLCFELFPIQLISIFGSGDALYEEFAVLTFRIYLSMIILCAIQKGACIFLQSLGKSVLSTILSVLRDFALLAPLILILPIKFGIIGALFAAPIADIISFVVTVIFMRKTMKEINAQV